MTWTLAALAGNVFPVFVLGLLRIGAAMAFLPAFGERAVPLRIKLVLTLALTALVLPTLLATGPPPLARPADWILAGGAEVELRGLLGDVVETDHGLFRGRGQDHGLAGHPGGPPGVDGREHHFALVATNQMSASCSRSS